MSSSEKSNSKINKIVLVMHHTCKEMLSLILIYLHLASFRYKNEIHVDTIGFEHSMYALLTMKSRLSLENRRKINEHKHIARRDVFQCESISRMFSLSSLARYVSCNQLLFIDD
jgi:hypothetical protein